MPLPSLLRRLLRRWVARPLLAWLAVRGLLLPMWRYLRHRLTHRYRRPTVRGKPGSLAMRILDGCSALKDGMVPPVVPGGVLQTALPSLWSDLGGSGSCLPYVRETLRLPERAKPVGATCCPSVIPEGEVSIDWHEAEVTRQQTTVASPTATTRSPNPRSIFFNPKPVSY